MYKKIWWGETRFYIPKSIPLGGEMDLNPFSLGLFLFKELSSPKVLNVFDGSS
jgi:hypothetical protein